MKIAFVILHYNTIEDTKECIDSIKKNINSENRYIIVVDNFSPNKSGHELELQYENDSEVRVILSEKNLGFAKGNNLGFEYAKKELKADFIVLMNNDTKILHDNFLTLVEKEYEKSQCAVIGPKVITPNPPFDSNPGPDRLPSKKYLYIQHTKIYIYLLLSYLHLDEWFHKKFGRQDKCRKIAASKRVINTRIENVQLHGCFWVFTPTYIEKFDGINNKTFLYYEEQLLFARVLQANMKTVYLSQLEIFHKEDSATNSVSYGTDVLRRRVKYKRLIESRKILIHELYG